MRTNKLAAAIGIGALTLLAAAAVLPPALLSSRWAQQWLFQQVPGRLQAERCRIGWRQGLECGEVVYVTADQGLQAEAAALRGSQGLWGLIQAPERLGDLQVEGLVLTLTKPAPQAKASQPADTAAPSGQKQAEADTTAAQQPAGGQEASDFVRKLQAKLLVSQAEVRVAESGQPPKTLLSRGEIQAGLAEGVLRFDLTGSSDADGQIKAGGAVTLPGIKAAGAALAEIKLHLNKVQIKPFLALGQGRPEVPQGSGLIEAELALAVDEKGMRLRGPALLTDADLSGGVLGEDHPRFGRLAVDLHVWQPQGGPLQLPGLQIASDFGSIELQAADQGAGLQGNGKGKVDLALLLAQFPHLFRMREEVRLDSGELRFTADLSKENGRLRLNAEAAVSGLAGRREGAAFAWDSPVTLNLTGSVDGQAPKVDKLILGAPFLHLEGQGDLSRFGLRGSADLDRAMQEIGRLIQLDWEAGGKLTLDLQLERQDSGRYTVSAQAGIDGCRLSRQGKEILPPAATSFSGRLEAPGQIPERESDAASLQFDLSSWAGTVSGRLDGVYRKNNQLSLGYDLRANVALARLTELLHKFEALDEEVSLAGALNIESSGYAEEGRLVLRSIDSRLQDFILYQRGKLFRDPALHLFTLKPEKELQADQAVRPLVEAQDKASFFAQGGGYSLIDLAGRRLALRDLEFNAGFGSLRVQQLALDDWQRQPMPVLKSLQVNGRSDLTKLAGLLQQLGLLAAEQKLGGAAVFSLDLSGQPGIGAGAGQGHTGTVSMDLERFFFGREGGLFAAKDKVEFRSRLHGDLAAGDIYFTTFDLQSPPLLMQSSGRLQLGGQRPQFSLEGYATPDLANLVAVLNGMYPLGISAAGRQKEKFSLLYPLAGKRQAELQFAGRLHADTFAKAGVEVSSLSLDTAMKDGVMAAAVKGSLNGGSLQLSPKIDYTRTPPLLTIAGPEEVLVKVGLEQALADLLKGIHPLLGSLASPTGAITVRAERFSMPLSGQQLQQLEFKIALDLSKVTLEPVSALAGILDLAGLGGQPLRLKDKNFACEGQKGRISCSPIKITAAESEMLLTGSTGLDGGLDYVLEVPVTKNLVGKKGYELLKGATLKVPIRGTKDKPAYDPEAMMQAASDLLGQAAKHAAKEALKEGVRQAVPKELEQVVPNLPGLIDGLFGK